MRSWKLSDKSEIRIRIGPTIIEKHPFVSGEGGLSDIVTVRGDVVSSDEHISNESK